MIVLLFAWMTSSMMSTKSVAANLVEADWLWVSARRPAWMKQEAAGGETHGGRGQGSGRDRVVRHVLVHQRKEFALHGVL